jgi:hypothetical protein
MTIPFSQLPGRHERHYRRKLGNPLFADSLLTVDDETLLEMQRLDHEELLVFLDELRHTVQQAVDLRPNEGSEVVLELKERLDRLYEQSAGLADDHRGNQSAIAQLIEVIMRNVERGAAGDSQALDELAQERAARGLHFELLRQPLVADLLHPQSTIAAVELAPSLLSEDADAVAAALQLFDHEQLAQLYADAGRCLADCAEVPATAGERLQQIAARLALLRQTALN